MYRIYKTLGIIALICLCYACNNATEENKSEHKAYYNPSIINYTEAIEKNPTDASLYYKRSIALSNINMDELALKDIEKAISIEPNNDLYWAGKGEILNFLNKHEQAVLAYSKASDIASSTNDNSSNYTIYQYQLAIAKSLLLDNKTSQSKNIIQKVLTSAPNYPDALYLLAQVNAAEKDTASAERHLIKSLNIDPKFYEASLLLGEYYSYQNNPKALTQYLYTFSLDSSEVFPLFQIGYYYEQQKDTANAIKAYKRVLDFDKDYTDVFIQLGKIYINQDSLQKANRQFKIAVDTEPSNHKAHYWLGKSFELLQNIDSAKIYYANSYSLNPKYKEAKIALEQLKNK